MRKVDKRRKSEMFRTVDDERRNAYTSNPHSIYKKMTGRGDPQKSRRDSRSKILIYKKKQAAAELARKVHKPRAISHLKERKASQNMVGFGE